MTAALLNEYTALIAAEDANAAKVHAVDLASVTANDTLVVVDMQHDFLPGGAFGVAEGDQTIAGICALIPKFAAAGGTVIVTRDYHPIDHCSFSTHGGPFPPHCIQGTRGSFLHEQIAATVQPFLQAQSEAAAKGEKPRTNVQVVFKAFSAGVDSFGAFEYTESSADKRISRQEASATCHCSLDWTGGFALFCSNQASDANAPPDVMSVLSRKPLISCIPAASGDSSGRMFVCGLAMDFCVVDTAVNFRASPQGQRTASTTPIFMLHALTRAAHVPALGGFLTPPKAFAEKLQKNGIVFAELK